MNDEKEELALVRIDRAINRAKKRQIYAILAIVSGILLGVLLLVVYVVYEIGNTRSGAIAFYDLAMKWGNGTMAVQYAKKIVALDQDGFYWYYRDGHRRLAEAYLLKNEPEKALETFERNGDYNAAYRMYSRSLDRVYPYYMGLARLHFKQNFRRDAFEEYCSALNDPRFRKENRSEQIRDTVLCKHLGDEAQKFSPFTDYGAFLQFMEEEFTAAGEPESKSEAMRMFRESRL